MCKQLVEFNLYRTGKVVTNLGSTLAAAYKIKTTQPRAVCSAVTLTHHCKVPGIQKVLAGVP